MEIVPLCVLVVFGLSCCVMLNEATDCEQYGEDGTFCSEIFGKVPEHDIDVTFRLYTRDIDGDVFNFPAHTLNSNYMQGKPIKFIVHGFSDEGTATWVITMVRKLLEVGDFNVITVDWDDASKTEKPKKAGIDLGAQIATTGRTCCPLSYPELNFLNPLSYDQASSNTRIIASRLKRFIDFLWSSNTSTNWDFSDIHLIGHSLGAHISGMTGKLAKESFCGGQTCIGRISGLDPARPNFLEAPSTAGGQRTPGVYCLGKEDAIFVDIIHTDATEAKDKSNSIWGPLGIYQPLGDVDFYPNGGNDQPGCVAYCDHGRAGDLFTASINSQCTFTADDCDSLLQLKSKSCKKCTSDSCQRMGYYATKVISPSLYYLTTTGDDPFCDCGNYGEDGIFCSEIFGKVPEHGIDVTFRLYTRDIDGDVFNFPAHTLNSNYMQGKPIKFIVHGFSDKGTATWVITMVRKLLEVGDFNVITVDWDDASHTFLNPFSYDQASSNTRIIASRIKRFIDFLRSKTSTNLDFSDIHLIGHSLGAHISGITGKWVREFFCEGHPCIGRISGLDPARPNFLEDPSTAGGKRTPGVYCLGKEDAIFVDIIHTDATEAKDKSNNIWGPLGIYQPLGDVDFYPNGGNDQPGCYFYCDHGRAGDLFTASINSRCTFTADNCDSLLQLKSKSSCKKCTSVSCQRMGYYAVNSTPPSLYHLSTTGDDPFCAHTLGCYVDQMSSPDMDHKSTSLDISSVRTCLSYCRSRAYVYAGLQYTSSQLSCWCGDTYGKYGKANSPSECSHTCRNSVEGIYCGGNLRNSIYETGYIGCVEGKTISFNHEVTSQERMYPQHCLAKCTKEGYEYAGLSKGDTCSCGNDQQFSNLVDRSRCATPCTGTIKGQLCGGTSEVAVLRTGIEHACIDKANNGDCDFFKCFSERHSTCSKYDIGGVLYSRCQGLFESIRYILSDREAIFACVASKMLDEYKQLNQTYSTTECKKMFDDGKKHYKSCANQAEPNQSNKRRSASSEENSFFDRLKDSDNLDDYKASIDNLVAAVESDPDSVLLEFMQEEVEELTLYFHRSGFHTHDDVLQTIMDAIEMKMVEGAPSINSKSSSGDSCEDLATGGNCAFFDCFENRFPCDPSGFALSFGKVYCEQENKYKKYLKATGGISIQSVQDCVMNAMWIEYQKDENTCKGIELTMIAAYRDCYDQYLDCDFVRDNQFHLTNMYALPKLSSTRLQDVAKSLVVTTLCDNHGSTLYSVIDNIKFLVN